MMDWIINNIGSIIVVAILQLVITLILVSFIKNKKKANGSCGCGCANCPMSKTCCGKKK
ncbi:MAG: FeoB-associated Cys-rich membrane protein [Clostridia bacterium]|nr:FeoB-associated Cys-rich membrane protein [Clostridia bacterium]